jgi:hypothetical protein
LGLNGVDETPLLTNSSSDRQLGARHDGLADLAQTPDKGESQHAKRTIGCMTSRNFYIQAAAVT